MKQARAKARLLKAGRVLSNIEAHASHLIAVVRYEDGPTKIRFFGTHEEYDKVNAQTV